MNSPLVIKIIKSIFSYYLKEDKWLPIDKLDLYCNDLDKEIHNMMSSNLIKIHENNNIELLSKGREKLKVVLAGGTYDLLHVGHLETLNEAANQGNFLVVVVARDKTVSERKRIPILDEISRMKMLNALSIVDIALLGDEHDHMKIVGRVKPDIITIGSDQKHRIKYLYGQLLQIGLPETKLVRLKSDLEGYSTSNLIDKIRERCD